jgi:hypothetical protein
MSSDLPGVNPTTLNGILLYYRLMTKWSGLGDSTELSRVGLSHDAPPGILRQRARRSSRAPPQSASCVAPLPRAPPPTNVAPLRAPSAPEARRPIPTLLWRPPFPASLCWRARRPLLAFLHWLQFSPLPGDRSRPGAPGSGWRWVHNQNSIPPLLCIQT